MSVRSNPWSGPVRRSGAAALSNGPLQWSSPVSLVLLRSEHILCHVGSAADLNSLMFLWTHVDWLVSVLLSFAVSVVPSLWFCTFWVSGACLGSLCRCAVVAAAQRSRLRAANCIAEVAHKLLATPLRDPVLHFLATAFQSLPETALTHSSCLEPRILVLFHSVARFAYFASKTSTTSALVELPHVSNIRIAGTWCCVTIGTCSLLSYHAPGACRYVSAPLRVVRACVGPGTFAVLLCTEPGELRASSATPPCRCAGFLVTVQVFCLKCCLSWDRAAGDSCNSISLWSDELL